MPEENKTYLQRMQDFLNQDINKNAEGNVPVFDRPEPIQDPTTGQAIRQAVNTIPSIAKDVATGVVEMGKQVYEEPTLIVDAAKAAGNIVWNPNDVPFIAALKSRLLRLTGNFDHVFNSAGKNTVDEIEKPLNDFIASKKEQYGEDLLKNIANNPEAFFMDAANFTGLGAAGKTAISKLVPDVKTLTTILDNTTPNQLVPAMATTGDRSTSAGQQTENLMPTIRETMAGPAAVDYDNDGKKSKYTRLCLVTKGKDDLNP